MKRSPSYLVDGKSCIFCLEEKLCSLKSDKDKTLNKRSNIFTKCRWKVLFVVFYGNKGIAFSHSFDFKMGRHVSQFLVNIISNIVATSHICFGNIIN